MCVNLLETMKEQKNEIIQMNAKYLDNNNYNALMMIDKDKQKNVLPPINENKTNRNNANNNLRYVNNKLRNEILRAYLTFNPKSHLTQMKVLADNFPAIKK